MKKLSLIIVSTVVFAIGQATAEVKLHALFSDNAVFQQGIPVPVWGTASDGEKVTVAFDGQSETTTARNGRWIIRLKPMQANTTPQSMTVTGANTITITNLLVGEVWICSGQSNMEFPLENRGSWRNGDIRAAETIAAATDPQLRLFTVPQRQAATPQQDLKGAWQSCTPQTVPGFSAVAYYFGRDLRAVRHVPVGLIHASWGATAAPVWLSRTAMDALPEMKPMLDDWDKRVAAIQQYQLDLAAGKKGPPPPRLPVIPSGPGVLFNGMIAPLAPFASAGVIWYQGESDCGRSKIYQTLFPALIQCWREAWQREFPFLFVQIAPCKAWNPELREAQLLTWKKVPKTAMVVITDCGADVHPRDKTPVGARLALAAQAVAYGEQIEYSGPVYETFKVDGNKVIIGFGHVGGGLVAKGGELKGFTIAGADPSSPGGSAAVSKKFMPATAIIEGETVVVSSPDVAQPVAVRYGWTNMPQVNLFNKADLPASPFRTDAE